MTCQASRCLDTRTSGWPPARPPPGVSGVVRNRHWGSQASAAAQRRQRPQPQGEPGPSRRRTGTPAPRSASRGSPPRPWQAGRRPISRPARPGSATLDQAGQQHVHQRDRATGHHSAGEQHGSGQQAPRASKPAASSNRAASSTRSSPNRRRQRGSHEREHPEAEHRGGSERAIATDGQVQRRCQFREDRGQAGDRGAQVEREREDAGHEQLPAPGTTAGPGLARTGRTAGSGISGHVTAWPQHHAHAALGTGR